MATSLQPLERGLRLLELAASSSDGVTYKQVHQYLGVSTATVARLLKVLVQQEYLCQNDGCYKAGPSLQRLLPQNNIKWILTHHGAALADEFAGLVGESCVFAIYDDGHFEFSGVSIIEGSFAYAPKGRRICSADGHVFSLISHALMSPHDVLRMYTSGEILSGYTNGGPPWRDYAAGIVSGLRDGHFLEYGWRRPHLFRTAVPVFSEDHTLAGAYFCGFYDQESLTGNLDRVMAAGLRVFARINGYEEIFRQGLAKFQGNLSEWRKQR